MKPARLLIAVVLLGVLGIVLWWSNKQEEAKVGKPAADAPPRILEIAADKIKQIEITRRGEAPLVVQFNNKGKWEITAPKPFQADAVAVAGLTSAVSKLDSERLVDANATDLPSYGLAPALIAVGITTKDGKTSKLLIGENTPVGTAVYAKLDGDPRLFTMASANKAPFDKEVKDLRDKRLLDFTQDRLRKLELTARKQTFEFARSPEGEWSIVKPKPMRADSVPTEELVNKIRAASMDLSGDTDTAASDANTTKNAAAFLSGTPIGIIKLTDDSGEKTLELRKFKDDYYAKSSLLAGIYKTSKDVGDALDKPLDDFRNKKLFDFGFGDPNHIEFTDGAKTSAFDKSGDKWTSSGKTMDTTSVQAFIDRLRGLTVAKFVDTGFTTPVVTTSVISSQGKHKEKIEISQAASGGNFIARHDGDSSLYEIDAKAINELRPAVNDIREAQVAKPDKKK